MKKFFWGFAALPLLALLATSCGKETVESKDDLDRALSFKAAAGKQTLSRASERYIADLQSETLEVHSYRDIDNTPYRTFSVHHNGIEWVYSPVIFHPTTFGLDHYSVHPTTSTSIDGNAFPVQFEYTVANMDTDQEDLMIASAHTTHRSDSEATAYLSYKHILSQINFAIQGKDDLIVEINNIRVVAVRNTGTFIFDAAGNGGVWNVDLGYTDDYHYRIVRPNATDGTNDIFYLGNEGNGLDNGYDNALMLMPQDFTHGGGAGFYFDYTLKNMGDIEPMGEGNDIFVDFGMYGAARWEPGRRYLYKIIFDPVLLRFEVDVENEWIDWDEYPYDFDVYMN